MSPLLTDQLVHLLVAKYSPLNTSVTVNSLVLACRLANKYNEVYVLRLNLVNQKQKIISIPFFILAPGDKPR
jgi:hypothetical protein